MNSRDIKVSNTNTIDNSVGKFNKRKGSASMFPRTDLNILSWNINGVGSKFLDSLDPHNPTSDSSEKLVQFLREYDLVCMQETFFTDTEMMYHKLGPVVRKYDVFHSLRTRKHKKAKRGSGGVVLLFKKQIKKGIFLVNNKHEDFLWVKLCKEYFGFEHDIYLGCVYLPPDKGKRDRYEEILEKAVAEYSSLGKVLLIGDMNARIGNRQDFVQGDHCDYIPVPEAYDIDYCEKRQSLDTVVNPAGEILLQLCKSSGLRILNGRYADDQPGKFTCHKCNGTSVVDYFIAHHSLISYISSFKVTELQELYSDHAPLTASLACRYDLNNTKIS